MKTNALLTIMLALVAILPFHKAYSASSGCFEEHLRESISINRTMREFYIKKGFVGVQKVYRLLIGGEHFSLPTAKYYDQKALTYQKKGMDLLCQEYVPMELKSPRITAPLEDDYQEFNWKRHKRLIGLGIKLKNAEEVKKRTLEALKELAKHPDYHCFIRHMLESIYRFAHFVEIREKQSYQLGIKSPKKMLFQIMNLHNTSLWFADEVDDLAAPIQKQGAPVLCNELPNLLHDLMDRK